MTKPTYVEEVFPGYNHCINFLKEQNMLFDKITIVYKDKQFINNSKPIPEIEMKGKEISSNALEEDYFLNLEDYMNYVYLSVLNPLLKYLNLPMKVTINVAQDGEFEPTISVKVTAPFSNEKYNNKNLVHLLFNKLSPLSKYVTTFSVKAHEHKIMQFGIALEFDMNELSKNISKGMLENSNRAVFNQWKQTYMNICEEIYRKGFVVADYAAVKGRVDMSTSQRSSTWKGGYNWNVRSY